MQRGAMVAHVRALFIVLNTKCILFSMQIILNVNDENKCKMINH